MNTFGLSLSASRLKTYLQCPFKYYLTYVVGIRRPDTFATLNGRIIHTQLEKMSLGHMKHWKLELLARYKRYQPWTLHKNYLQHEHECETCASLSEVPSYHGAIEDLFINDKNCPKWHIKEAVNLIDDILIREINPFDYPLIDAEHKFKLHIGDNVYINGFIDLVSRLDDETIEIRDWKTGNWLPSYADVREDAQLRIYDLAASILFPQYKNRLLTLDYIKHKCFTFVIDEAEREDNRLWLIDMAKKIEADMNPRRISNSPSKFWKCKALCSPQECNEQWPVRHLILQDKKNEKFLG
jgi:CRISPR/Cas system-associated exonuclease Cas4 (RecB family)